MELAFAGVAAIAGIAGIGGIGQLGGGHLAVLQPEPAGLSPGLLQQMRGQRRGDAGHRQGPLAEAFEGQGRHQRTVDPAGIGHHHPREAIQPLAQLPVGLRQGPRQGFQQGKGGALRPVAGHPQILASRGQGRADRATRRAPSVASAQSAAP